MCGYDAVDPKLLQNLEELKESQTQSQELTNSLSR